MEKEQCYFQRKTLIFPLLYHLYFSVDMCEALELVLSSAPCQKAMIWKPKLENVTSALFVQKVTDRWKDKEMDVLCEQKHSETQFAEASPVC